MIDIRVRKQLPDRCSESVSGGGVSVRGDVSSIKLVPVLLVLELQMLPIVMLLLTVQLSTVAIVEV